MIELDRNSSSVGGNFVDAVSKPSMSDSSRAKTSQPILGGKQRRSRRI